MLKSDVSSIRYSTPDRLSLFQSATARHYRPDCCPGFTASCGREFCIRNPRTCRSPISGIIVGWDIHFYFNLVLFGQIEFIFFGYKIKIFVESSRFLIPVHFVHFISLMSRSGLSNAAFTSHIFLYKLDTEVPVSKNFSASGTAFGSFTTGGATNIQFLQTIYEYHNPDRILCYPHAMPSLYRFDK